MSDAAAVILVIDDEVQNRKLFELLLRPEGYTVITAADGEEALAAVALRAPDLILLDVMMPRMNGYQVAKKLKADSATADIPIIMVTALVDKASRLAALEAGAEEFLTKPVERNELSLRVRNMLRIKAYSDFLKNHSAILEQQVQERSAELLRFRMAMDKTADAITMVSRTTMRYVEVNATACEMFGYTREELLRLGPSKLVAVEEAVLAEGYDEIIAGHIGNELAELRFRRKDGSQFQGEVRRHAQRAGNDWVIVGVVKDITQQMEREDEARRFRAAMEISGDGIVLIDRASMRYVDVNQTLCDLVGYSRDEVLGMTPMDLYGTDRKQLEAAYDAIIAGEEGAPARSDGLYRHKDGSQIPVEARRRALHTDNGWIIVSTARDIRERKKAERSFKDLLEFAPDAMVLATREGEILLSNSQTVKLFGWSSEELLGQKTEVLVPERFRGEPPGAETVLFGLRKDGSEFPVEISRSPLETSEGTVVMSAIRDITERQKAEHGIRRLNRVYAVLSGINGLIVRVRDRDELFKEACQIAINEGGFRMSMISAIDRASMQQVPIAWAGMDEALMAAITGILSSGAAASNTMTARAAGDKKPIVSNDSQNDAQVHFGRQFAESGVHSMAFLPLIVADEVEGVLALFSEEAGFFDEAEMKLLTELAGDIAFAMDQLQKQERLDYLAYYDPLTGLANRTLFLERLAQHMRSASSGGHKAGVFMIDVERFKDINDTLGRPAGDTLLTQIAEWMALNLGDASLLARVGGDHFAAVLPEVKGGDGVARLLEKKIAAFLAHPFRLDDAVFRIAGKVGVALYPQDGADAETLFRNAEAALKKAKGSGDRYLFYAPAMNERAASRLNLENQLRQALDKGEFVLHYQPKINLASGLLTSAEALLRWNDPRTGLVPPGRFIPILEETGLIHEVGRWALRQAIDDYLRWRKAGLPAVRIAVNVSPLQLRNRGFVEEIRQLLGADPLAAARLELEITESLIMEDVKHSIASLGAIRALGVTIAIDDFGTGFSSLSQLAKLPVDTLKIDRSFIVEMTTGPQGLALVSTVINLAHSLKLKVVAEGVETEEQSRLLRLLSCDEMQGYLFSRPVPGDVFEAKFLQAGSAADRMPAAAIEADALSPDAT